MSENQTEPYQPEPFDLKRPTHLVAKDLLDRIGQRNRVQFGPESLADVQMLIKQMTEHDTAREDQFERERIRALEAFAAAFKLNRMDDRNVTWVAVLEAWKQVEATEDARAWPGEK